MTSLSGRLAGSGRNRRQQADRIRRQHGRPVSSGSIRIRAKAKARYSSNSGQGTDITRAIQDARDKIALIRPSFPRDVKDPQVVRVDVEDNRPTVSLAVLSPTVEPARAHLAHRSDDRQGAREHSGRGAGRRQRPRDPADPHPDQALGAGVARHRRRSGDDGDSERQPGRSRRPHHARPERLDRAGRRQDQGPGPVRPDHRRAAGRGHRSTCPRSPT